MTPREERAARWPAFVPLNLYQLSALLAVLPADTRRNPDRDLAVAVRRLENARARRQRAVKRAGGRG